MLYLLVLIFVLLMVSSESRRLDSSPKSAKAQKIILDDEEDFNDEPIEKVNDIDDEERILPDEVNLCLKTDTVYTSANDSFFDPDLMRVIVQDVSINEVVYFIALTQSMITKYFRLQFVLTKS